MHKGVKFNMEKTIKAVGYCRFSSDKQREESIEAQQEAILRFANANNYEIIQWYIDRGISARTDYRPQFLQMIEEKRISFCYCSQTRQIFKK